jgi:hypothetical protein
MFIVWGWRGRRLKGERKKLEGGEGGVVACCGTGVAKKDGKLFFMI